MGYGTPKSKSNCTQTGESRQLTLRSLNLVAGCQPCCSLTDTKTTLPRVNPIKPIARTNNSNNTKCICIHSSDGL